MAGHSPDGGGPVYPAIPGLRSPATAMNDYWIGFCQGVGTFAVLFGSVWCLQLWCQRRLDKAKDDYIATLKENYEEAFTEAVTATVAHDALLHVLRNRNDEGEEWKR